MASPYVVKEFREKLIEHLRSSSSILNDFFRDLEDDVGPTGVDEFNTSLDDCIDTFLSENGDQI